jgi:hypothetical protein
MLVSLGTSQAQTTRADSNPTVPPGRDPGGIPVAIIGPGIDYRLPEIAGRLARDGEGDLIGWDFADNDARPFEQEAEPSPASTPARLLLGEAGASRIAILRLPDGDRRALATALLFASQSPARIVAILAMDAAGEQPDWPLLADAAQRFPDLLLIAPDISSASSAANTDRPTAANLLIVSAATKRTNGAGDTGSSAQKATAELAVPLPTDLPANTSPLLRAKLAAMRTTALAARIRAVAPELDARELKQRILSLTAPLPPDIEAPARSGWIAEPQPPSGELKDSRSAAVRRSLRPSRAARGGSKQH